MANWNNDLSAALASGDPHHMLAMLARVPDEILRLATPAIEQLAHGSDNAGKPLLALAYHECLVKVAPGRADWQAGRVRALVELGRHAEALQGADIVARLAPDSAMGYCLQADVHEAAGRPFDALAALRLAARCEPEDDVIGRRIVALGAGSGAGLESPTAPASVFDPALFADAMLPADTDSFRVEGLRQHLRRHGAQLSPGHAIARLEDPVWRSAWDGALAACAERRVYFQGSELGVLALRALHHGAASVYCAEAHPLDTRIATGMAQKHLLKQWHALHRDALEGWSPEQRRESFESFAGVIDIAAAAGDEQLAGADCFAFPHLDHSLLGTGIVAAVRRFCDGARGRVPGRSRVLPARATVFAMGVCWKYPGAPYSLEPINALRWGMQAQALALGPEFWTARTASVECGSIDFAAFEEAAWELALPVQEEGAIDAIVFWYELELGGMRVSNRPGGTLRCILPAVQYIDTLRKQAGDVLELRVQVDQTRLFFQTRPPLAQPRSWSLPSWYVPMMGDRVRSDAYAGAIGAALAERPAGLVLDIGSGCGLLSMLAVRAGAERVVGCETHPGILDAGRQIVAGSGLAERITLVGKDCRRMQVPEDLPERADLALFELFDCSLIGEGVLHFLDYARTHLLAHDARYLPAGARIRAVVVEYRLGQLWDVDASLLNPYRSSPAFASVDAATLPHRVLSEPFDVFSFDFASAGPAPQEQILRPQACADGAAGALLFWFDLRLDATRWISNAAGAAACTTCSPHWKQGLQVLPEVRVKAGSPLPLVARHDGSALAFQWLREELDQATLSPVPRFDPRWLAANAELEQQTRSLLQHCAQSREEYLKVADIAKRFAVDPAAHGLDPAIAHRFASLFLN